MEIAGTAAVRDRVMAVLTISAATEQEVPVEGNETGLSSNPVLTRSAEQVEGAVPVMVAVPQVELTNKVPVGGKRKVRERAKAVGETQLEPDVKDAKVWPGGAREQHLVLDLKVLVGAPKQWVVWTARRATGTTPQVDTKTAQDWALKVIDGSAWLRYKLKDHTVEVCGTVRVTVVEWNMSNEGLYWPASWNGGWRKAVTSRPEILEDGSLQWCRDLERAPELAEEEVQRWWGEKADEALRECLDLDHTGEGGFFEKEESAPDTLVLGSWVHDALRQSVEGLEPVCCEEVTHTSNPAWARERQEAQVFTAGNLHGFVEEWRQAGADEEVLGWLKHGYHIKLGAPPEDSGLELDGWKGIHKRNGGVARENVDNFRVVVMNGLKKHAWEVVLDDSVVNRLPMNLAPKAGKEPPWRLILNAMELNEYVPLWSVRYETLKTVPLVVAQGDWLFSIDFTDAYYQLLLDAASQKLVGASIEFTQAQMLELEAAGLLPEGLVWDRQAELVEVAVRPRGLPMGFRNSCAVWTKTARVLTTLWRRKGFKLVHLLDDLLFSVTGTYEEACKVRDEVLADLDRLGILVNWGKSVLCPNKCTRFLGMLVNSQVFRFFIPPDKVEKMRDLVVSMADQPEASIRSIASIVGKVMSTQIAVPAVRIVSAGLYALIRPEGDWDRTEPVTESLVSELCGSVKWV